MVIKQEERLDMQALMETYKKLATPGAPHKALASMAGRWDSKTLCWMETDQPTESRGTVEQKMILDGHYLQQEFSDTMLGNPFKGICVLGYDNHARKYVSTWIDSMNTGIMYFEGTGSADGRIINQTCHWDDPIRGPMTFRSVYRIFDSHKHTLEMYGTDKSGKEEKMMESTYTRKS